MIAKVLHPDAGTQLLSDEEYSRLTLAYKTLSSPDKRALYDDQEGAKQGNV